MKRKHEEPTRYARLYTQLLVFVDRDVASLVLSYAKEPDKKLVKTITTKKDVVFLVDQGTSLRVVDEEYVKN